jgi:hypothetical protein
MTSTPRLVLVVATPAVDFTVASASSTPLLDDAVPAPSLISTTSAMTERRSLKVDLQDLTDKLGIMDGRPASTNNTPSLVPVPALPAVDAQTESAVIMVAIAPEAAAEPSSIVSPLAVVVVPVLHDHMKSCLPDQHGRTLLAFVNLKCNGNLVQLDDTSDKHSPTATIEALVSKLTIRVHLSEVWNVWTECWEFMALSYLAFCIMKFNCASKYSKNTPPAML